MLRLSLLNTRCFLNEAVEMRAKFVEKLLAQCCAQALVCGPLLLLKLTLVFQRIRLFGANSRSPLPAGIMLCGRFRRRERCLSKCGGVSIVAIRESPRTAAEQTIGLRK